MSEDYQLSLYDYLEILKRRWLLMLAIFVLVSLIGVSVALLLPPVYQSSGTILVESQQISEELIQSTITSVADEQLSIIRQRVMTRSVINDIIEKFDIFKEKKSSLTVTEQVELFKDNVKFTTTSSNASVGNKKNKTKTNTLTFTIAFENKSPEIANKVANELVTLILNENVKNRTERASETTEFLAKEAAKLKKTLEEYEDRIAAFKQENSNALPEHLDLHMSQLERTNVKLQEIERDIKAYREEARYLEIELSAAKTVPVTEPGQSNINLSPQQRLALAETALQNLLTKYSEKHPDVRRKQEEIDTLKQEVAQSKGSGKSTVATNLADLEIARVQTKINAVNDGIASLTKQQKMLEEKRGELENLILQTPQVQRAMTSLNRDYENTLKKYKEIQEKELEAKLTENLEQDKKAENFLLIEPPVLPEKPIKPNRQKIMLLGLLLALASSVGLIVLLEMLDQRVRSSDMLTSLLKERPLVVIPYVLTQKEILRKRKFIFGSFILFLVVIVIGLTLLHMFYLPLDILFYKVLGRLG